MRNGKRSVPQAGGSRGMDVRTEARGGEEARTYPASEFSYTGFSSAGVAVSQVVKTAQSRGRTERTLLFAGALAGRSTASPTASRGAAGQAECRGQA